MSSRRRIITELSGVNLSNTPKKDLIEMFSKILNNGIHGLSFSPYLDDQGPGSQLSEEQIRTRMKVIAPYIKWTRSFSCTDGNEIIPRIAHEHGIKTLVGAWLGYDAEKNENEIAGIINVAKAGHADMIAIGNEVLLRGDLSEDEIIGFNAACKK